VKNGQSGNPGGRPREKEFAAQLRLVLAEPADKSDPQSVRKMRRIAEKLVDCALNGEPWAIAQVADRIDGKPTQMLEHSTPDSEQISNITWEIVHVTKTREELDRENDRPLMIEHKKQLIGEGDDVVIEHNGVKMINGNGSGNGHSQP
jgi:hypothetical protein